MLSYHLRSRHRRDETGDEYRFKEARISKENPKIVLVDDGSPDNSLERTFESCSKAQLARGAPVVEILIRHVTGPASRDN